MSYNLETYKEPFWDKSGNFVRGRDPLGVQNSFGHYWLKGNPVIENNKGISLDYSVAKGGLLVAFKSEFISKENQKEGFVTNLEE